MERVRDFFLGFTMSMGALAWALAQGTSPLIGAAVGAAAIGILFLPWQRMRVCRRILSISAALLGGWGAVMLLQRHVCTDLPLWQIIFAFLLFTVLLAYIGGVPLRKGAPLLGVVTAAVLVLLCVLSVPFMSVPSAAPTGGIEVPLLSLLVLVGSSLSAWEYADDQRAARGGAAAGAGLYILLVLTASAVWSSAALKITPFPVFRAWERINSFSVFYCPEVLAASLCALCTVLQWSALSGTLFSLQKQKKKV